MKKIFILLLLAGCSKTMSVEQVEKAKSYCESKGLVPYYTYSTRTGYVWTVDCIDTKNNLKYKNPESN